MMKKKWAALCCLCLCLALGLFAAACGDPGEDPPAPDAVPIVAGVRNGGEYELEREEIRPTFDVGSATLAKDGGAAAAFVSGTQIEATGSYVLLVVNGAERVEVAFAVVHALPRIAGVVDHSTYYAGIDEVRPAFDLGTATLAKDDAAGQPFVSGTEVTELGKYALTVTYEDRTITYLFWIEEYRWLPGEGEHTLIDDFSADNWTNEDPAGTTTVADGTLKLDLPGSGMAKTWRDVDVCTETYHLVAFSLAEVDATWDAGFKLTVSNRGEAGWPTAAATGDTMLRVKQNGKWLVFLDLNDATQPDKLVGMLSVKLHFEFSLEGEGKSVTFDEIRFVDRIPTAPEVTGVQNGAAYTLGEEPIRPVFSRGTATLSRNGGAPQPFVSGTEIARRGNYVLTLVDDGVESVVSFTVADPLPGADGRTLIDDFSGEDWICDAGSVTYSDSGMTLARTDTDIKVHREIELDTTRYSIVRITLSSYNAGWDGGLFFWIGNRNVAGWPSFAQDGGQVRRAQIDGKWCLFFDFGALETDTIVGKERVRLHFEFELRYGGEKEATFEEISFVESLPEPIVVTGVADGETYSEAVTPLFDRGTATLSKDGGEPQPFASGTEVVEAGSYVLTVTCEGLAETIRFTVAAPQPTEVLLDDFSAENWTSESGGAGSLTYSAAGMTLTTVSEEGVKVWRELVLDTRELTVVELTLTGVEAGWDAGMNFLISNRGAAGWPTLSVGGGDVVKVEAESGVWKLYFDLSAVQAEGGSGNETVVGQERVALHFEFELRYGTGKSMTFARLAQVSAMPAQA